MIVSELLIIRMFSVKVTLRIGQEILILIVINSVLESNTSTYKIIDLNGKQIIWSFYEKQLSLSKL